MYKNRFTVFETLSLKRKQKASFLYHINVALWRPVNTHIMGIFFPGERHFLPLGRIVINAANENAIKQSGRGFCPLLPLRRGRSGRIKDGGGIIRTGSGRRRRSCSCISIWRRRRVDRYRSPRAGRGSSRRSGMCQDGWSRALCILRSRRKNSTFYSGKNVWSICQQETDLFRRRPPQVFGRFQ